MDADGIGRREPDVIDDQSGLWKIGVVAARLGVSERTLRYYDEVGLVRPADHGPGGSRRYCEADIERVKRVRELQELMGFNLEEIRSIISADDRLGSLRDRYRDSADQNHQRHLLEEADRVLADVRAQVVGKLGRLEAFLAELDLRIERHHHHENASKTAGEQSGEGRTD